MKHLKTYNESIKDILKPKSNDKIGEDLFKLSPSEILRKSIEFNYLNGFRYLCVNDLVDETTKYILEKYELGLHQDEPLKDYEKWFLNQITDLNISRSKHNNILMYKKNNEVLFNYDEDNYTFYYDYDKIYSIFKSKFNLNNQLINILVKSLVEEHLKIRVDTILRWACFE